MMREQPSQGSSTARTRRPAFTVVVSEPAPPEWSLEGISTTLSRGKVSRFNIAYYQPSKTSVHDAMPSHSFKLRQFYQNTGRTGQYRYQVHVAGRDAAGHGTDPAQAYILVKWGDHGYPKIELEPIMSAMGA